MALHICYDPALSARKGGIHALADEAPHTPALQSFLAANYDHLRRRLIHHLGCADLASECLHDAWLRLGETEARAAVLSPEAYVYRVACNIAMDRIRHHRAWQYTGDADTELEHVVDEAPGPDHIAAARSELAAVENAMERLPRRHRSVLVALRIDEMTRQEVASCYHLSLRSVDTVLRQALDYCAENTGQLALAGVRSSRRALRCQPVS